MSEALKRGLKSLEVPTEALLLPGKVFWANADPALRDIVGETKLGAAVKVPFVFPGAHIASNQPNHQERSSVALHESHRRHSLIDTPSGALRVVLKGTGLVTKVNDFPKPAIWHIDESRSLKDKETYVRGLCDISEAVRDRNFALIGNSYGGSFGIPLAILTYDELPYIDRDTGEMRYGDMKALRKAAVLPHFLKTDENDEPTETDRDRDFSQAVCYSRAMVSNERIDAPDMGTFLREVDRLIPIVVGKDPSVVGMQSYFLWLARMQITNLAVLHGLHLINSEYDGRNMTFGGELVDLSACEDAGDRGNLAKAYFQREIDVFKRVLRNLEKLISDLERSAIGPEIDSIYADTFNRARAANQSQTVRTV